MSSIAREAESEERRDVIKKSDVISGDSTRRNLDASTVDGFGVEWARFTQTPLEDEERQRIWDGYFRIFPWGLLPQDGGVGADVGCGSGRWGLLVAERVRHLHLIDASDRALRVARNNLAAFKNVSFHHASVEALPIPDGSLDFAYSLGVLHHVPDTLSAIQAISAKLKSGAPFLVYLYYALDGRPGWFRLLWHGVDGVRRVISRLPDRARHIVADVVAAAVYWPLARSAAVLRRFGLMPVTWPLAYYHDKSFYVMRTDSLDRFGTRLESRYTRGQIANMLVTAGFEKVVFSETPPYWCAIAIKA